MRFHPLTLRHFVPLLALLPFGPAACGKHRENGKHSVQSPLHEDKGEAAVLALRNSIPGGQVILPDEPAFALGRGWGPAEYHPGDPSRPITVWTIGDHQEVDWAGPTDPGDYKIAVHFWRPREFPRKEIEIEYLLPGETEWKSKGSTEKGAFVIEGKIKTAAAFQRLHFEAKMPSWVPAERIPGSTDRRSLGMTFLRIELAPLK